MGSEDNLRVADHTEVIGSNQAKSLVLLEICEVKRDCSYLPTGTLRRTSSKKRCAGSAGNGKRALSVSE